MSKLIPALVMAAAMLAAPHAVAQDETGLVMYVAPGPDYRVSLGFAEVHGDQVTITDRMEMAVGCAWSHLADITVPADEPVQLRMPSSVGGAERFGVLYATTYSALVARQGANPAVENHTCIRRTLTAFARSSGEP